MNILDLVLNPVGALTGGGKGVMGLPIGSGNPFKRGPGETGAGGGALQSFARNAGEALIGQKAADKVNTTFLGDQTPRQPFPLQLEMQAKYGQANNPAMQQMIQAWLQRGGG